MALLIRPARVSDAEAISAIRVQSWRETYVGLLSAEFLGTLDAEAQVPRWRDQIAGGRNILVAEVDGETRGFAIAGPAREANPPRDLELQVIYQLATEHGSGSGQALLDAAIGDRPAVLWVAEQNPRAQAFYRRNGFAADGTRKVVEEWDNLVEIRMVR
jgi:GNAT superfamily N-acetyltransferase